MSDMTYTAYGRESRSERIEARPPLFCRAIRQNNANGCALPQSTFGFHPAAVELCNMFDDRQAQTSAAELTAAGAIGAIKAFENTGQIGWRDAYPLVGNGEDDFLIRGAAPDENSAVRM